MQEDNNVLPSPNVMRGPESLIEHCQSIRGLMLSWESMVLKLKTLPEVTKEPADPSEMLRQDEALANIIIAYRHVEDARMRLGKVIQAMDGGVSIYDKPKQA